MAQRRFPAELVRNIQGKTRLADIMKEVNRYYDFGRVNITKSPGEDDFESNDYEWWKKWEYWARRRLNPDGTLADYKTLNFQAKKTVDAKFGPQLKQAAESLKNSSPPDEQNAGKQPFGGGEPQNLSYGNWSSIGPTTGGTVVGSGTNIDINGLGRMDRIAFNPTNGNIFYVCSPSGGIFKTINAGSSWTDVSEGLPGGVSCIEVSRVNGNIIYAFSGDGDSHYSGTLVFNFGRSPKSMGVFRSTDAGASWSKVTDMYTGLNDLVGHNMAISQNSSNLLFAATSEGLYRTTDGGNSWTRVRTGNHYDVEFKPYDDDRIYASTASNVYYSADGGDTWNTSTFDFSSSANRIDLGVRKNNASSTSGFVYALCGLAFTGSFRGLFLSTDMGVSFTRQTNTPNIFGTTTAGSDGADQTTYDLGICVKPTSVSQIATAGCCVWKSSNGGATMTFSTTFREGNGPLSKYIHPDVHDVEYNPVNNNLYACTDGGVFVSTDDGGTWTDISDGNPSSQFYHMGMQDANGDGEMEGLNLVAGAQDNGIKYRTTASAWRHIICCDGFDAMINGNDADWLVMNINSSLYQTPNGGSTMNYRGAVSFFSPMAVDYDNGDTMYVGSSSLLRSYDGFVTNTSIGVDVNNFITTCPSNNARIYGSSSSATNLRISEDRGSSWTTISGNTGWPAGTPTVSDCKPWLTNSSEIYVTFAGYTNVVKVYRSTNAGTSWTNYSGSLPNVPIHCCAVAAEGIYVGTEIGVFFRADGAADWTPFYNGMPRVIVTDIWVNSNGNVYASTFGRGIWFASRYSTCPASISVTGTLVGPRYYEASSTANVTATASAGAGTDVFVKSNGYVDLKEGFEIKSGTFFKAYLGPCSSGGIPDTNLSSPGSNEPNRNIIEYDDKDITARRKQNSAYYALLPDGIEVNLTSTANLIIEVTDVKSKKVKKLVNSRNFSSGMYKILTGEGIYEVKVKMNGKEVKSL